MAKQLGGSMGSHKHGVSGTPGHSPRFRHQLQLEINRKEKDDQEKRARRKQLSESKNSVVELFSSVNQKKRKKKHK